jgi:hypothetical protein
MLDQRRGALGGVVLLMAVACTAVTTRPRFGPKLGSLVDTLKASPETVIRTLATTLAERGLKLHRMSEAEGYIETAWFDPVTRRSVGQEHLHTNRVFRIRAFADSIPPNRCQLAMETVYRRVADPSQPGREEEILVPPGSRPDSLTQRLLSDLRQRFGK